MGEQELHFKLGAEFGRGIDKKRTSAQDVPKSREIIEWNRTMYQKHYGY